jgi:hypothetical protein
MEMMLASATEGEADAHCEKIARAAALALRVS